MKKVLKSVISVFAAFGLILLATACNVGLGESVDTAAPKAAITYPPEGAVIRDSFVLAGTCSDDKGIESIKVTIKKPSDENFIIGPLEATVTDNTSWKIDLNKYDIEKYSQYNGWELPDGTYKAEVTVYDKSGHEGGPYGYSFDIDNTAPVFVVTAPGVKLSDVNSGVSNIKKYGSSFTISGTIAENHKVDMTAKVFASDADIATATPIIFSESAVDTSGTASVEFARYIKNAPSSNIKNSNYWKIYGEDITDTSVAKPFKTVVILSDNAKEYKDPSESSNTTTGNTTSKVFLNDSVYSDYLSGTSGLGITATDFMNILNGTKTGEIASGVVTDTCENVRSALNAVSVETSDDLLSFSLNPNADPIYTISGYDIASGDLTASSFGTNVSSKNSSLTVFAQAGENQTNIEPKSLKLWIYDLGKLESGISASVVDSYINTLVSEVSNGTELDEDGNSAVAGWTLVGSNAESKDGSDLNYQYSVKVVNPISIDNYYLLVATGWDQDGAYLSQKEHFGFKGQASSDPPEVTFKGIDDQSYVATTDDMVFDVVVTQTDLALSTLYVEVVAKDETTGNTIEGTFTKTIDMSSYYVNDKGNNEFTYNFKLSDMSNYAQIALAKESGKSYFYTVKASATNKSGGTTQSQIAVHVDTTKPVVNINSISPYIEGSDRDLEEDKTYLNGTIKVSGNVTETNLSNVIYEVYEINGSSKTLLKTEELGIVYSFTAEIDTTQFTTADNKEILIVVTATDKVGNAGSHDSTSYNDDSALILLQSTDTPIITLPNQDVNGNNVHDIAEENVFTNSSSNSLSFTVEDDDGIKAIYVTVYDEDGNVLIDKDVVYNPTSGFKTKRSINYALPSNANGTAKEGIFGILIETVDSTYTNQENRKAQTPVFYIGVDTQSPSIEETKITSNGLSTNSSFFFAGTAGDTNGLKSLKIIDTSNSNKTYEIDVSSTVKGNLTNAWTGPVFVTGSTNSSNANYLADGKHTFEIMATDTTGRTSTLNRTVTVDTTAPTFGTGTADDDGNIKPYVVTASSNGWYNTSEIKIKGSALDTNGTGVSEVSYCVKATAPTESDTWTEFAGTSPFNGAASGVLSQTSYIWIRAVDFAGNVSTIQKLGPFNIDTSGPTLTDGSVKINGEALGSLLTNGDPSSNLAITAALEGETATSSGYDTPVYITIGAQFDTSNASQVKIAGTVNTSTGEFAVNFPASYITRSGAVWAHAVDKAGNAENFTLFSVTFDAESPTVEINAPTDADVNTSDIIDVNGKITINGTAKDNNTFKAVTVIEYTTSATPSDSDWTEVPSYTFESTSYNWKIVDFDTTKFVDNSTIYIRARGTDTAGNIGYSNIQELYINQRSDRPVINFNNLVESATEDGVFLLTNSASGNVNGSVSDDDKAGSQIVKSLTVIETDSNGVQISSQEVSISSSGNFKFAPVSIDDGAKYYKFKIIDNDDTEFNTGNGTTDYTKVIVLSVNEQALTEANCANVFSYKADKTSPIPSASALASDGSSTQAVSTAFYVGGTTRSSITITISATDTNGIAGMTASIFDAAGTEIKSYRTAPVIGDQTITTGTTAGTFSSDDGTWALPTLDVSTYVSGSFKVVAVPYDKSGLTGNGTFYFSVDNEGPTVTPTSPAGYNATTNSEAQNNGIVTVTGTATDSNDVTGIKWLIPTKAQQSLSDTALKALDSWNGDIDTSVLKYTFSGETLLDNYANTTYCSTYDTSNGEWWVIPIYFLATDEFGNSKVTKTYSIKFNPDLDKPEVTIENPDPNTTNTLGGTIRMNGASKINEEAQTGISVAAIYVQIGAGTTYSASDAAKAGTGTGNYGYTVINGYDIINEYAETSYSSSNKPSDAVAKKYGFANAQAVDAWWGIKTTPKANGNWTLNLNEDGQMNPTSGTNNVYLRACGVNSNGKVGPWSSNVYVEIDNDAPETSEILYQFINAPTTATVSTITSSSNVSGEKDYTSNMFIKGQWWIETTVQDDSAGVKIESVTQDGEKLTEDVDFFTVDPDTGTKPSSTTKVIKVYTKVNALASTTVVYKVTALDVTGLHSAVASYSINVDNDAPDVYAIASDIDRKSAISMTKIENSNYTYHMYGSGIDSGAGLDFLAVYFKRTVNGNTTIELPLPSITAVSGNQTTVKPGTAFAASLSLTEDGLYGVKDAAATYSSYNGGTKITTSASAEFIRVGSLVKLSGSYYEITEVGSGYVAIAETFDTDPSYAFFPAAIAVNNTIAESGNPSGGIISITNDDGDGYVDYVKKADSGAYTWELEFFSDELEDGQIEIVVVAGDRAGNYTNVISKDTSSMSASTDTSTTVMLTNHKPRVSKVYLSTDLNGNGSYTDNELGGQAIASGSTTVSKAFYSALSGTNWNSKADEGNELEGNEQEIATLSYMSSVKDDEDNYYGVGFTLRNKLGVAFEFVGGREGSGDDLYYKLSVANSTDGILTAPVSGTTGTLAAVKGTTYDTTADTTTSQIVGLKGFEIQANAITANTYGTYTEWVEATAATHKLSNIGVTLWDSTNGTTAGVGDTVDGEGNYTAFGSQWTVINIPIYIDLADDQKPVPAIKAVEAVENEGHVDLSSTLPSRYFSGTSGYLDTDTKISGKVEFTGTITDEKRVNSIALTTSSRFNNTQISAKTIATYNTATGAYTITQPATGLVFAIVSNEFDTQTGHTVEWSLTVDSSYVANIASADVTFTITAADGSNTDTDAQRVDIVPYITGIWRLVQDASASSDYVTVNGSRYVDGTTNRSRYGDYAVVKGEYLRVTGYNLPNANVNANATGTYVHVGNTGVATTNITGTKEFVFQVPANSGELRISVSNILSINEKNSNSQETTNLEKRNATEFYYDNRYLRVWDINHQFTNIPTTATTPAMAIGNDGSLYGQYVRGTDAQVILINGLDGSGRQIFRCYDQPLNSTALSVDTKASANGGGASSLFFMANVGNSGTVDSWAMTDVANTGSVAAIGLTSAQLTNKDTGFGTGKVVTIAGNPLMRLDSNVQTSFYPLASYSMKREITPDLLTSPRTAKYGNALHNVFYDSQTKGLKYSYVSTDESGNYMEGSMAGWVVVDGGYNGQDRLHTWSTSSYTNGQYGLAKRANNNNAVFTTTNNNTNTTGAKNGAQGAAYSNDLIQLTPANKSATSCTVTVNDANYWRTRLIAGSTIAFLTNGETMTIDLTEITNVTNNGTTFTLTYNNCPGAVDANYATIYTGEYNVVGLTSATSATVDTRTSITTRSTAAGKYSDIDVTSGGYPVIAYFDSKNETVRVVYATSTSPTVASSWNRVDIPGVKGGTHVSMKIDPNNVIHIMYRNSLGAMEYVNGTITGGVNSAITGITFGDVETIDSDSTTGTYGSISTIYNFESSDGSYTPCVTYLNSEETENALKYAVRRKIDDGNDSYKWDAIIMPATERYAVGGSRIYLGGKSSAWTTVTNDGVSVADCYSTVGYLSSGMDVVFLKVEK